ncbi:uncharacterized protein LOC143849466 [Tasmannia lanceolata]|uniref:uncharacterized protein LOC143849466 n=1 Tax=Tasmannia lanceolata TaxID=3420 RepID=UPI004064C6C0
MAVDSQTAENPDFANQKAIELGDEADLIFSKRGCCFWIPCFQSDRSNTVGSGSIWWGRIRKSENEERWWEKGWKKVRELSEIVAGPKWKTFIRRFNKNIRTGGKQGKFQYDPLSYALNFDEGHGQNGNSEDEFNGFRGFSARYAVPPVSAKSSMDLGKDGPDFTATEK